MNSMTRPAAGIPAFSRWKRSARRLALAALGACGFASGAPAQQLLMEYNLNTPPNDDAGSSVIDVSGNGRTATIYQGTVANGGWTSPAALGGHAGVSSASGDQAFRANTAPYGSGLVHLGKGFGTLTSFTVCGWFKTDAATPFPTAARFVEMNGNATMSILAVAPGDWELQVGGAIVAHTTGGAFNQTQQWTFLAVTYDSTTSTVCFYRGLPSGAVTLVSTTTGPSLPALNETTNTMQVTWGNAIYSDNRTFPGNLDDLRIYGSSSGSGGALGVNALAQAAATAGLAPTWSVINLEPTLGTARVGFYLLTHGGYQFAAYYDAVGQMTVAMRRIQAPGTSEAPTQYPWTIKKLASTWAGFDAHNYVTLALDANNCLHVAGNMHDVPLCYFRATVPYDVASLTQVSSMTAANPEGSETYPIFFQDAAGHLIYSYRNGDSGDGDQYFDIYNPSTQTWAPLLTTPLLNGSAASMNAYLETPVPGPDGYFHAVWVWRDTPDVSTNHDLSYMRSLDLVHWTTLSGTPLALPVTPTTPGVVVDPIPTNGGIINGCEQVGFDPDGNVVISYLKYDSNGYTQIYLAREEAGAWNITKATNWTYRWNLEGLGSITNEITIGPVTPTPDGRMTISYTHTGLGSHTTLIDPVSWTLTTDIPVPANTTMPPPFFNPGSSFPAMGVRGTTDAPGSDASHVYVLRNEALSNPGDNPYPGPYPQPQMLQVIGSPAP